MRFPKAVAAVFALAASAPALDSAAVYLSPDGMGQALIFPYYTARAARGNPFNTYLSIVNHSATEKALRVRFREARLGKEVASFNLYLARNDAWTGVIVPTSAGGARLMTSDRSCTDPLLTPLFDGVPPPGDLPGISFAGGTLTADGAGDGLDRTREGFIEVLEMATLTGGSATAASQTSERPANCPALRAVPAADLASPTGGISGTLTLINVASGQDFTLNADALAQLTTRHFFRPPADSYPSLAAAEIDPVSMVVAGNAVYRSLWPTAVDAVSAALMRASWSGEFTLDAGTASLSDVVITLPTRPLHLTPGALGPFAAGPAFGQCSDHRVSIRYFDREQRTATPGAFGTESPPLCAAASFVSMRNGSAHIPVTSNISAVLGSTSLGLPTSIGMVPGAFENGWIRFEAEPGSVMTSLPGSQRLDLGTGEATSGPHRHVGLPVLGFSLRTFANGTLACAGASCQGNYGGAFPLRFTRTITAPGANP